MTRPRRRVVLSPAGPTPRLGRTMIVLQAVAALLFVGALLRAEGVRLPFTGDAGWTLRATFDDASGLRDGLRSPVLVSGVPSGTVDDVRLQGGRAVVTLRLDEDARGKVRTDAVATVEPRSALEDLTVNLTPGSASAPGAPDGGTIPTARTRGAVTLDRVTAVLDADTRSQLALLLDQLAVGLRDRPGALRDAITALAPAADSGRRVTAALSERRDRLARLVGSLDRLATAMAANADALERSVTAGRATVRVSARRQAALAATVRALPGTLRAVDDALRRTTALATPLDPALRRLRPAARALPGALRKLQQTTPDARALLTDVDALVRDGGASVARLRSTLRRLGPTATRLTTPVRQLQPIVKAFDDRRDGIGLLGERFSGVLSTNDENGAILRGLGFFEAFNPANFGVPGATGARLASLKAQVVRALVSTCRETNALACLTRYLVPGLPGAVRSLGDVPKLIDGGGKGR
ncbi:MlaD family protein [Paraconexibacter sp. AEG42_29]|uniref:MlaD family protein n=1 Tax=Paraconexibacter sp. AEG42_29 TaxID=2997339 RepID=UPI00339D331E